jgi:hypothetical protein
MSFPEAHPPAQEDVGVSFQEPQREEMLDLGAIDLLGPAPLELLESFDPGEAGQTDAPAQALFLVLLDFTVGEPGQIIAMGPTLARRLVSQRPVLVEKEGEFEEGEVIGQEGGFHGL